MDPILKGDLEKKRKRMEDYLEHSENSEKQKSEGNLQGKKVTRVPSENSVIKNLFKHP